jgi:hypothetical protein
MPNVRNWILHFTILPIDLNLNIIEHINSIKKSGQGKFPRSAPGNLDEFVTRKSLPRLTPVMLWRADFGRVDLGGANGRQGADSFRARTSVAHLRDSDFAGSNPRRAGLRSADLPNVDLGGANLCRAKLVEATLTRENLRATKRDKAAIDNADFRAATFGHSNHKVGPHPFWNWH